MKIIFDSEEQKAKFIHYIRFTCPKELDENLRDKADDECDDYPRCDECWETCGIEMEVKKDE